MGDKYSGSKNNKNNLRRASKNVPNSMVTSKSLKPPAFKASIQFTKVVRYQAQAALDGSITAENLATILTVATAATTGASIVGAIRLNQIEMWSPASQGASVSCEFTQESTTFIGSPSSIKSDTAQGTAFPAYISMKPPKNSLSGFWISGAATSSSPVITLTCSEDSIIDLHVTIVLLDQTVVGQTTTGAGMTAGVLYWKNLIGAQLIPVAAPGY